MTKKQKPSMTESLLRMSGIFKDYDKTMKLYERYNKDKLKLKTKPNQLDELLTTAKNADATLKRFITAYSKVNQEVNAESGNDAGILFMPEQREGYLNVLKERATKLQAILMELAQKPVESHGPAS